MKKAEPFRRLIPAARFAGRIGYVFFGCLFAFLMTGALVSKLSFWPEGSLILGLSYVPVFWIVLFSAPIPLIAHLKDHRVVSLGFVALSILFVVTLGDYSLRPLFAKEPLTNGTKPIRTVALNVQYFDKGADRVGGYLADKEPDVIMLSEFVASPQVTSAFMAYFPGYRLIETKAQDAAVLTKLDVDSVTEVRFPSRQPSLTGFNTVAGLLHRPRRTFLHVTLSHEGNLIHVIPVRFIAGRARSHNPLDKLAWGAFLLQEQQRELDVFKAYVSQLRGPLIFGGDINATPSSFVVEHLSRLGKDTFLTRNLFGQFTFLSKFLPMTKERTTPMLRLDYLFHNDGLHPVESSIERIQVSDHFPLFATYQLTTRS